MSEVESRNLMPARKAARGANHLGSAPSGTCFASLGVQFSTIGSQLLISPLPCRGLKCCGVTVVGDKGEDWSELVDRNPSGPFSQDLGSSAQTRRRRSGRRSCTRSQFSGPGASSGLASRTPAPPHGLPRRHLDGAHSPRGRDWRQRGRTDVPRRRLGEFKTSPRRRAGSSETERCASATSRWS